MIHLLFEGGREEFVSFTQLAHTSGAELRHGPELPRGREQGNDRVRRNELGGLLHAGADRLDIGDLNRGSDIFTIALTEGFRNESSASRSEHKADRAKHH